MGFFSQAAFGPGSTAQTLAPSVDEEASRKGPRSLCELSFRIIMFDKWKIMKGRRKGSPTERSGREGEIVPEPLDARAQAAFEESFRNRREVYEALVNL